MGNILDTSWFMKYKPKGIDEYVFESKALEDQVQKWLEAGHIDGNLLLCGKPGTGKSALISILVNKFIKNSNDLNKIKSRSVQEIDALSTWVQKRAIKSSKKIIVIEEFDRLSNQALIQLKDGTLENFQSHATFIATTNYLNKIDPAVQSRFNHIIEFKGVNQEGTYVRLKQILDSENITYNEEELKNYAFTNFSMGLRNLITSLQVNALNGQLDFSNVKTKISSNEELIINKTLEIMNIILSATDITSKKLILSSPLNSPISQPYAQILEIAQFSRDLHYETIYEEINNKIHFLPLKILVSQYLESHSTKKLPYLHYLAFLSEAIDRVLKLNM
jgi:DNA polymerase III delta prime subunit